MCVTETHFNEEIHDAEISVPNYVVHREDRGGSTKGGGSAIYTHNSLSVEKIDWFRIHCHKSKFGYYRILYRLLI